MSSNNLSLGDLLEVTSSKRIHMADYVDAGVPFYRGKEVIERAKGNKVSTELFIHPTQFENIKSKFGAPKPGDILLTSVGTLGVPLYISEHVDFYFKDGNLTWLRNFKQGVNPKFIYYWLTSPKTQQKLDEISIGSTQRALTIIALKSLKIELPTERAQAAIVEALDALTNRITLLRETNKTLEAIAQAIFKSWFVDFDPVRAKMEGRQPEGMDEATAALFPDSFEESELGLVPKGWTTTTIQNVCEIITNGSTPSRANSEYWENGDIPWIKTGELADGFLISSGEKITGKALSKTSVKLLPENSILMAIYAAPTVGRLGVLTQPSTFNQACTGLIPKNDIGTWFLFWTLFFGREWFNSRANGAAQQNISKKIVEGYKIVLPPKRHLSKFDDIASQVHKKIRANAENISILSRLRDTLLPRLISGQLRLPEVQEQTENALT